MVPHQTSSRTRHPARGGRNQLHRGGHICCAAGRDQARPAGLPVVTLAAQAALIREVVVEQQILARIALREAG